LGADVMLGVPVTFVIEMNGVRNGNARTPEMMAIMMVSMRMATKRMATPWYGDSAGEAYGGAGYAGEGA
jgi:hypothetical protein